MSKHYHPTSGSFHSTSKKAHLDHLEMAIHHGSNGLRPNTNGIISEINDTNNNYNNNKHHTHHKRSAGIVGEASSSKRTKLSVPSDKSAKEDISMKTQQQQSHYNIMEKLKELYKELKGDKSCKEQNLSPYSFLLDKLVTREKLHTLIINLYPGNKGYSLSYFRTATSTSSTSTVTANHRHHHSTGENLHETPSFLYDNSYLLDALDSEELPPLLIDFCKVHCPHLFYDGNVIAQIRDYRQSYPLDICDIHYVLLRPSAALWDEINAVVDSNWTMKEKTTFESQLVLATADPICLDPSPKIGIAAINATTERAPFATDEVRKYARRFLQVTKNRNNKLEKKTHYHQTALASHLATERRSVRRETVRNVLAPELKKPSQLDGIEGVNVKCLQPVPANRAFDWQAKNTERLTFETDRDNTQYKVRVDLFERATSCEVSGQLTLERQKGSSGSSGRTCPFKLSSPLAARRYVKEFMGIFTEEGRKFVKITHERETKMGREILEMQTGESHKQGQLSTTPKIQTLPSVITSPPSATITSPNFTSPPPPALVATAPQIARIAAVRPNQVVVLAQVKPQESCSGNQVIKNLLNQPRAPMTNTNTIVNGHATENINVIPTVFLSVDQSNLIQMGSNIQFITQTPNLQALQQQQAILQQQAKRSRET